MSTHSVNLGNQILVFDYRQEARGKGFNQAFCDVLPYGVYSGGELVKDSDTSVIVKPLVCVIRSNENDSVALRIETTETYVLQLAPTGLSYPDGTKPYIVLRFGWTDVETNFMNIIPVAWSDNPEEDNEDKLQLLDIILGKINFQETSSGSGKYIIASTGNPFDLSRRQGVFLKDIEKLNKQFQVMPSENDPQKVSISGGKVNTSKGQFIISGEEFPDEGIPPTTSMGRTDLIIINAEGEFELILGTPSALNPAPAPKYETFKVLAEIQRGPSRVDVKGSDIVQITDATIRGQIYAEDFPLADTEDLLPVQSKNIEDAINFIVKYLNDISGEGRTTENIKDLADAVDALMNTDQVTTQEMINHFTSIVDEGNVVHGIFVETDLDYPVD